MTNKMKPWTCKHGHILGYIRWNGSGLPQLMLLREPLDMTADQPDVVDLLGPLDGQINVRCKVCDDLRFWEISVESLLVLFSTLSDKKVFEFSQRLLELSRRKVDLDDPIHTPIGLSATSPKEEILGEERKGVK